MFPEQFNTTSLDGKNGFAILGMGSYFQGDFGGVKVSRVGDINNDGFDDVLVGSPASLNTAGQSFIIYGTSSLLPKKINSTWIDGNRGIEINGIKLGDQSGYSVSGGCDINGDKIDDVVVGAPDSFGEQSNIGQVYVLYGNKQGFPKEFSLSSINGSDGFTVGGLNSGDQIGMSVCCINDINNDGFDDVLIGAPRVNGGDYGLGSAYILFGNTAAKQISNLNLLDGTNGFTINGVNQGDYVGWAVSGLEDINGDDLNDLIVSAQTSPGGRSTAGQSYVVFGSKDYPPIMNISSLDGANGFTINGINSGDLAGTAISSAGDVNNDNIADIILGSPFANNGNGQSYIIFGTKSSFPVEFELSSLNGKNGFIINGFERNNGETDQSGSAVSNLGDVDGDDIDDVAIGAPGANKQFLHGKGHVYTIFGSESEFPSTLNVSTLDGKNGFIIEGDLETNIIGGSIDGLGDFNGDGLNDIIVGANELASDGQSYVIFGQNHSFADI